MNFFRFTLLTTALAISPPLMADEIYKWVDENGKVHFSDTKPESEAVEKIDIQVNTYTNVSFDSSIFDVGPEVVMYSTTWCGYCKKAKRYFEKNNIAYKELDIEKSSAAAAAYKKLGARGVPVILVGDKRMNGFSEQGFKKIYTQQ